MSAHSNLIYFYISVCSYGKIITLILRVLTFTFLTILFHKMYIIDVYLDWEFCNTINLSYISLFDCLSIQQTKATLKVRWFIKCHLQYANVFIISLFSKKKGVGKRERTVQKLTLSDPSSWLAISLSCTRLN